MAAELLRPLRQVWTHIGELCMSHPDQMPWRMTAYINVVVGGIVGLLPPFIWKGKMHDARNPCSSWTVPSVNRFEVLSEEVDIEAVQIDVNLKEAVRGRINTDSGAVESVLPNELIVECEAKRRGVKYVAANGGNMENIGEKKVKFKKGLERHELHHFPSHRRWLRLAAFRTRVTV